MNWLRVLDTTELSQVYQRIRQQLYPIVPLLHRFKTPPPPLERIFHAKVRSLRARQAWMASLKNRLRPRCVVLRLHGCSLMLGIMPALNR